MCNFYRARIKNWKLSHLFAQLTLRGLINQGHPIYSRICDEYALNVTGFPVDESRTWVNPSCVYTCDYVRGSGGTKRAVDAPEIVKNRVDSLLIDDRTSPRKCQGLDVFLAWGKLLSPLKRRETLIADASGLCYRSRIGHIFCGKKSINCLLQLQ